MKQAARVFNVAKQDVEGYEACAEELVTVFGGDREMLEYVLEGVFHIAKADGVVHPQEEEFLRQVSKHFGFTDAEFTFMKARHALASKRNPYDVLGVKPSVSNEELISQYRRLVAENQPNEFSDAWHAEGVRPHSDRKDRRDHRGLWNNRQRARDLACVSKRHESLYR